MQDSDLAAAYRAALGDKRDAEARMLKIEDKVVEEMMHQSPATVADMIRSAVRETLKKDREVRGPKGFIQTIAKQLSEQDLR